jgi:hypothetical protein
MRVRSGSRPHNDPGAPCICQFLAAFRRRPAAAAAALVTAPTGCPGQSAAQQSLLQRRASGSLASSSRSQAGGWSWLGAQLPQQAPPSSYPAAAAAAGQFSTIPVPDDDIYLYERQLQQPNFVQPISIVQLDNLVRCVGAQAPRPAGRPACRSSWRCGPGARHATPHQHITAACRGASPVFAMLRCPCCSRSYC